MLPNNQRPFCRYFSEVLLVAFPSVQCYNNFTLKVTLDCTANTEKQGHLRAFTVVYARFILNILQYNVYIVIERWCFFYWAQMELHCQLVNMVLPSRFFLSVRLPTIFNNKCRPGPGQISKLSKESSAFFKPTMSASSNTAQTGAMHITHTFTIQ